MTNTNKPIKDYYIRIAGSSDTKKIIEFYKSNKHANVRDRDASILKERAESGAIIFIEDAKGNIVASSVSYAHKSDDDTSDQIKWLEIGSTRVAGLNGYPGVFDVMVTLQMLRAFLVEPPEEFFIGHMEHSFIQKTANRLGWRMMDQVPKDLQKASNKTVSEQDMTDRSKDWFKFTLEGMPIMAKAFQKVVKQPIITHVKTGEQIRMNFNKTTLFNIFKNNIARLAEKDLGSVDAPNPKNSFRVHRDTWLKKHFR